MKTIGNMGLKKLLNLMSTIIFPYKFIRDECHADDLLKPGIYQIEGDGCIDGVLGDYGCLIVLKANNRTVIQIWVCSEVSWGIQIRSNSNGSFCKWLCINTEDA